MAGTAHGITNNDFFTGIGFPAVESMNTKVIGIIETALVPGVLCTVQSNFLRNGSGIFAQELGYILKGIPFIQRLLYV
jgi:hypothetical protein